MRNLIGLYFCNVSWLHIGQQGYTDGTLSPIGWDDLQTVRQLWGKMTNTKSISLSETLSASQSALIIGKLNSTNKFYLLN